MRRLWRRRSRAVSLGILVAAILSAGTACAGGDGGPGGDLAADVADAHGDDGGDATGGDDPGTGDPGDVVPLPVALALVSPDTEPPWNQTANDLDVTARLVWNGRMAFGFLATRGLEMAQDAVVWLGFTGTSAIALDVEMTWADADGQASCTLASRADEFAQGWLQACPDGGSGDDCIHVHVVNVPKCGRYLTVAVVHAPEGTPGTQVVRAWRQDDAGRPGCADVQPGGEPPAGALTSDTIAPGRAWTFPITLCDDPTPMRFTVSVTGQDGDAATGWACAEDAVTQQVTRLDPWP